MVVSTNNLSNSASLTGWFLHQVHSWFLEITLMHEYMCVCVCVRVYASEIINNQWHDFDFI